MTKHRVTRRFLALALTVLLALGCVAPAFGAAYESGTYTGTARGRNGDVSLTLTLANGAIASVDNVTHSETTRYWEKAKVLLDQLIGLQTPEQVEVLDAVTGATLSSNAIKNAAQEVFRQAQTQETSVFASGSGTKNDPYLIRTVAQLEAFAAAVNGGTDYAGQYISLDEDLNLEGISWTPIGANGAFRGSFNGNYHTITGMTIGTESEKAAYTEAGLFGSVGKGAAIRNLGVLNASIFNKTTSDPSVGILAAGISESSVIENCWATGKIFSDTSSPYYSYVGGLVGSMGIKSLICNSWTDVAVYVQGSSDSFVGGVVGETGNTSAVVNCAALGSVGNYGNTSMMYGAGGVVGYSSGAVYASYSSSPVHMDAMSYEDGADVPVGGVVGSPSALSAAYNCYFNTDEKQTYYDGEVSAPQAIGYDVLNYCESDNEHCQGLSAEEIASDTLLNLLTAALTPEELEKGQAYFKSEGLLTGDVTLDSLLSMTENGWCGWETGEDGALLPTAGGSVTPEEPDYFAGGDGSVGDPYQIATEEQLRAFAEATQAGKLVTTNVYFVLTADIALNGQWTPIHSFGGTFDGGNHTVSNMAIGSEEEPSDLVSAGFFDVLTNTASVHDLHLTNASVYVRRTGAGLDDRIYAGGLVGGAGTAGSNVRIDNCSVTGSMISAASGTFAYAGGLAGRLDRENYVTNCWTDIAVSAASENSPACAGGLIATIGGSSMVANAGALGDVSVTGVSGEYNWCRAGGLLGSSAYLTHNCYASGNVSLQDSAQSVKNVYLGCLIGEESGGVVVSGHYAKNTLLSYNGEAQEVKATGSIPASWYFDYNKITAQDSVRDAAFAMDMNDGVSEAGLAETDAYLTTSGTFTSYTAESLGAMRPAEWQSWGLAEGKVVLGGSLEEPTFAGGDGTEEAPYLIRTEEQLRRFAAETVAGETYAQQYVALDADITLHGDWTPIHGFAGSFDGRGHRISGISIGSETAPVDASGGLGFFDVLANNAQVRNLHLTDVSIYGSAEGLWTRPYVGGLAGGGVSAGVGIRMDNCSVTGSVISLSAENWAYSGGLIGALARNALVTNCWTDVTVMAVSKEGLTCVGGICGTNSNGSMLANCAALGDVISRNGYTEVVGGAVGGLIGQATGLLHNCYASGNVELVNAVPAKAPSAGMLVGQISTSRPLNGLMVGCRYEEAGIVTVEGVQAAPAAAGAVGASALLENVKAADTGADTFADTMNEGLSAAGLSRTDRWLTGEDVGFTSEELEEMRPEAWYAWERSQDGKTVLSDKVYEEPEIPTPDFFDGGDGTQENPWIIRTLAQLQAFRAFFAESDFDGAYIALEADLNLTGEAWEPLGHTAKGVQAFRGHFDGRGHTISGMNIGTADAPVADTNKTYYGLFAALMDGASVVDLRVEGSIYVTGQETVSAGLVAGCSDLALVDRCYGIGTVQVRTENGSFENSSFAGGLVGYSQRSEIYNCGAEVTLDAYCKTANAEAGGITAMNAFGIIANSYAAGTLTGATDRTVEDSGVSYLGGIAGCQAGTVVNCYSDCVLISKTWTKFVGAIGGMATAISESYDSYYSENAALTIEDQRLDPAVPFGTTVPSGYNEDGELMDGAFVSGVSPMPLEATALAEALNGNFAAFPIDPAQLTVSLLGWTEEKGRALPKGNPADITYVPVEKPEPTPEYAYKDGVYYGRDEEKQVIVRIVVEEGKVISAEILSPENFDPDHAQEILAAVVANQTVERSDGDTAEATTLKSALKVALNRALLGDTSTYDSADPGAIFDGGSGTKADPYRIATAQQLRAFALAVNEEEHFSGEYILLTADIDLMGREWIPVGNAGAHYFSGIFDGGNHKILGLRIGSQEKPADYVAAGLFACADGAIIRNLAIENAQIDTKRTDSVRIYAGIVAGVLDKSESGAGALVSNCAVSGRVNASSKDWSTVGGVVGQSYDSVILNCSAHVDLTTVSASGSALAGGIVGLDGFSILANSYAVGSIYADAGVNSATIGGIAGMQAGVAGNNYADMKLTSKNATGDIGGLAGRNTAIGVVNYGYFNAQQEQRSGNSVITPAKDIGTNVTMGTTGVVRNTAGMTASELSSEAFRDLLNENQCEDHELRSALQEGISNYNIRLRADGSLTVDSWILDGEVRQKNSPALELNPQIPEAPVISPEGGSFHEAQTVTIATGRADVSIYYTLDGSDPLNGTLYTGPFVLEQSAVVRALAIRGNSVSVEARAEFTIEAVHNALVTFITNGGSVLESVELPVGSTVDLSAYHTERSGYDFTGWYLDAQLTQPVTSLILEADTRVYAGWAIQNPFADVAREDYFYAPVLWGVENGIVKGMDETYFVPDGICTRAQALTFLWRAEGMPQPESTSNPFVDVEPSAYYYQAVLWGVGKGIVKGMDETHFEPNTACSRAHALTFLWRVNGMPQGERAGFEDVPVNAYYAQAVAWGVENGIVKGMDETHFEPDTLCARAHALTFLWRAYAD